MKYIKNFLTETYEHVPGSVFFSSSNDNIIIFTDTLKDLLGMIHNDKIIFYPNNVCIYIHNKSYVFTYFDIKSWRIEKHLNKFTIFLYNNLKFIIISKNLSVIDEIILTLENKINIIMNDLR